MRAATGGDSHPRTPLPHARRARHRLRRYVADLDLHFGHLARFYWDGVQGHDVGVEWREGALDPVPFRVAVASPAPSFSAAHNCETPLSMIFGARLLLHRFTKPCMRQLFEVLRSMESARRE